MLYEKKGRYIVEFQDIPSLRQHQIELEVSERKNYRESELGFDEERALKEAKRCLSCRRCLGCALCWAECKPEAIIFEMEDEVFDIEADAVVIAPGVDRPINRVEARFAFGKSPNVITDLQLERMLSDGGPSAGLIIRPYDGEIPRRIAFVQGYASAAPEMQKAALCLGINEAILARKKLPQAEISVFAEGLAALLGEQPEAAGALDGIQTSESAVSSIEPSEAHDLKVTIGTDGGKQTADFDLVVLITQPQVSAEAKNLSKRLGLNLAYANFLAEGKGTIAVGQ